MQRVRIAGALAAVALLAGCGSGTGPAQRTVTSARSSAPVAAAEPAPARPALASPSRAAPKPAPVNHCAHNRRGQLVTVSLRAQHAWMCVRKRTVFSTAITSGMLGRATSTPTGHYTIQGRNRDSVLTLDTGAQYHVKYWIPFDAPLFGFHDSSWQQFPYGSPKYRTHGSHGCVHLPLKAMRYLYKWANIGATVNIA